MVTVVFMVFESNIVIMVIGVIFSVKVIMVLIFVLIIKTAIQGLLKSKNEVNIAKKLNKI
jgi:hypothetical protein